MSSLNNSGREISEAMQIAAANSKPIKTSASKAHRDRDERRHSREDALSDREFEQLINATYAGRQTERDAPPVVAHREGRRKWPTD